MTIQFSNNPGIFVITSVFPQIVFHGAEVSSLEHL